MRVCLTLKSVENRQVILPTSYNHLIQSAIYSNISQDLADFLHNRGFLFGKRQFKMFTFSRLQGHYMLDKVKKQFIYDGYLTLHISSSIEKFIKDVANNIVKRGFIILNKNRLEAIKMKFPAEPVIKNDDVIMIRMLSPLTVYSTLLTPDGKKKTYYYSPYEKEFSRLINLNIKKKYFLLNNKNIKSDINITPLRVKEVVTLYKDTVVKGWIGSFILKGSAPLIKIAYESGLGAKNSQGFGMFEVVKCSSL